MNVELRTIVLAYSYEKNMSKIQILFLRFLCMFGQFS